MTSPTQFTARVQDSGAVCGPCVALTKASTWQEVIARRGMEQKS